MRLVVVAMVLACGGTPSTIPPTSGSGSTAPPPETVNQLLARAAVCRADADCVHIGDWCAAGCAITVNQRDASEVQRRLTDGTTGCTMDCPPVDPPVCDNGRCRSPERREVPVATAGECQTGADCALSCLAGPTDCCGDACGCKHVYPIAEAQRIADAQKARCGRGPTSCPKVKCVDSHYEAQCIKGACVAVQGRR
jgi:hypothetical protein